MSLLGRLDDAINPIVMKELRQAVQSRLIAVGIMLFLLLELIVLGLYLLNREPHRGTGVLDFGAGREAFQVLQAILAGTCILCIPIYAGVRLALERADANVDLLFISTLKPRKIISGKLFAAMVLALLVFSTCAPFMTFTYLLRGLDIPTILLVLGIDLLAVLVAVQSALLLAVLPGPRALKGLMGLAFIGVLITILSTCLMFTTGLVQFGLRSGVDDATFWAAMASGTGVILAGVGHVYFCAVALVNPPTANRALPVRVYYLILWLSTGILALVWALESNEVWPLEVWMGCHVLMLCGYLVVAVNERDHWGSRVAKKIPRWSLFRMPAFLLYSGAAGGVLYSVLLIAATLLACWGYWQWFSMSSPTMSLSGGRNEDRVTEGFLVIGLYTYCYAMTAALCRAWLLARWIKPMVTWLLAIILVGVGTTVPWVLAWLIKGNEFFFASGPQWWWLGNPFMSLTKIMGRSWRSQDNGYDVMCLTFLGFWAAFTAAASLPWIFAQVRRFRPPVRSAEPEEEIPLAMAVD